MIKKKFIVVAKYFEPIRNARAIQATQFVEHLTEVGDVVLITAGSSYSKTEEGNNLTVIRVPASGPLFRPKKLNIAMKLYNRLKKELECTFGSLWSIRVSRVVVDLLKKENRVVLSLSEPLDSHLAIYWAIKRRKSLEWYTFFSDPLPHSILPLPYRSYLPLISWLQEKIVKLILLRANGVLLTSSTASSYLEKSFGLKLQNKAAVMRHFCPDFNIPDYKGGDYKGYFVHIGHLTKERVDFRFMKSIITHINNSSCVDRVKLYGKVCSELVEMIDNNNWRDKIEIIGEVKHDEAIYAAKGAKALLLLEGNIKASPFVPSKLAEYFRLQTPIIALTTKDSEARKLLLECGNGVVCDYGMKETEMVSTIESIDHINITDDMVDRCRRVYSSSSSIEAFIGLVNR